MIPKNAERIVAARMKGLRPADMVLVALGEPSRVPRGLANPVVVATPGIAYDWRWVRDLDICVYVSGADDWPALVKDIARQWPRYLGLWNVEENWGAQIYLTPTRETVDGPRRYWQFDIDFLPWMDFQNTDFVERRRYERDENGLPYAI